MHLKILLFSAWQIGHFVTVEVILNIAGIACQSSQKKWRVGFKGAEIHFFLRGAEILVTFWTHLVVIEATVITFWAFHFYPSDFEKNIGLLIYK
jgi:hypothetical protein